MSPVQIVPAFLLSFSITYLILPLLARISFRVGLLDHPGRRKVHGSPMPLVGGIGMMAGVLAGCLILIPFEHLRGFYAGVLTLLVIGVHDDYRDLSQQCKFAGQILAALCIIYLNNTVLFSFGDLLSFGPIVFDRASVLLTVFSIVGVINAMNLIDGVDGLAGGVSLVAFSSFAVLAFLDGRTELVALNTACAGACAAFLRYNWHPSSLFMGDAGSLTLGFALTFSAISLTQTSRSTVPPVAPLLILSVPIVDTLTVMVKRYFRKKSFFHADRTHLHHIFLRFGVDERSTAAAIIFMTAVFSTVAVAGTFFRVPEHYLFAVFMAYAGSYFAGSFAVKRFYRARRRSGRGGAAAA